MKNMTFDIKSHIHELINKVGIPANQIYDHSTSGAPHFFEGYYQACQTELNNEERFNIQPARLYIRVDQSINARASKPNNYYLVYLNIGLVEAFRDTFMSDKDVFATFGKKEYSSLQKDINYSLQSLMFQWSLSFIFRHEAAHLFQISCGADFRMEERYLMAASASNFSLKHHMYEIDADAYAALLLGRQIAIHWKSLEKSKQTDDNLYSLLVCSLATVFLLFLSLQNPYSPIYYKEGDHPHPFVRTTHIIPSVVDGIERVTGSFYKPPSENIIGDTVYVTDAFLIKSGQPPFLMSAKRIYNELNNVLDYVKNVIHASTSQFPALMINQKKK